MFGMFIQLNHSAKFNVCCTNTQPLETVLTSTYVWYREAEYIFVKTTANKSYPFYLISLQTQASQQAKLNLPWDHLLTEGGRQW